MCPIESLVEIVRSLRLQYCEVSLPGSLWRLPALGESGGGGGGDGVVVVWWTMSDGVVVVAVVVWCCGGVGVWFTRCGGEGVMVVGLDRRVRWKSKLLCNRRRRRLTLG